MRSCLEILPGNLESFETPVVMDDKLKCQSFVISLRTALTTDISFSDAYQRTYKWICNPGRTPIDDIAAAVDYNMYGSTLFDLYPKRLATIVYVALVSNYPCFDHAFHGKSWHPKFLKYAIETFELDTPDEFKAHVITIGADSIPVAMDDEYQSIVPLIHQESARLPGFHEDGCIKTLELPEGLHELAINIALHDPSRRYLLTPDRIIISEDTVSLVMPRGLPVTDQICSLHERELLAWVCLDIVEAIEYMRDRDFVHNDTHFSNILYYEPTDRYTLIDFGFSEFLPAQRRFHFRDVRKVLGRITPDYSTDLWYLGHEYGWMINLLTDDSSDIHDLLDMNNLDLSYRLLHEDKNSFPQLTNAELRRIRGLMNPIESKRKYIF